MLGLGGAPECPSTIFVFQIRLSLLRPWVRSLTCADACKDHAGPAHLLLLSLRSTAQSPQVRSLMYVSTLVNEVMRAMADVEAAWEAAAAHQTTVWPFVQLSRNAGGKYTRCAAMFWMSWKLIVYQQRTTRP